MEQISNTRCEGCEGILSRKQKTRVCRLCGSVYHERCWPGVHNDCGCAERLARAKRTLQNKIASQNPEFRILEVREKELRYDIELMESKLAEMRSKLSEVQTKMGMIRSTGVIPRNEWHVSANAEKCVHCKRPTFDVFYGPDGFHVFKCKPSCDEKSTTLTRTLNSILADMESQYDDN